MNPEHSDRKETGALALVRLSSELSTKAQGTHRKFLRRLGSNIREALLTTGHAFEIDSQWNRVYVRTVGPASTLDILARIPGISSFSIILGRSSGKLQDIVQTGQGIFEDAVRGKKYAVRARRTGKHSYTSNDILYDLGSALNAEATVDLDHPDVEVEVEVRDNESYFYSGRIQGLGGLPLGVEGRAICLLSGGFDSAVAAWMMLKRGVQLDYVFCNLAGGAYERSVLRVASVLAERWSHGYKPKLYVLEFTDVLEAMREHTQPRFWQLVLKRLMYKGAEALADEIGAQALVTGECIGQVSSQTLSNLAAIDGASQLPVFRPLIGFDKMDIVELTRLVGTHDISATVKEYCAVAPGNPVTNARPRETEIEERLVDRKFIEDAVEQRKVLDLKALRPADLIVDYLFESTVPEGAVVVDVRSDAEWEKWHHPDALHHQPWEIESDPRSFDSGSVYIFYCDAGAQSAQVAEMMQRFGFEAYAYQGGTRRLKKETEGRRNAGTR